MIDRDLSKLYPPFAFTIAKFIGEWNAQHPDQTIGIFEGFRSFDRQAELYAQGRTRLGKVVTNAMPGFSFHNYGLACDIVFDADPVKPAIQYSWDARFPWDKMGKMAQSNGLDWSGSWRLFKELAHVENRYGIQLVEARELYARDGIKGVWAALS